MFGNILITKENSNIKFYTFYYKIKLNYKIKERL